jgi:hypothetical protein
MPFGIAQPAWDAAKKEAGDILRQKAQATNQLITYGEIAKMIVGANFSADDKSLHELLGEISTEEDAAGRGMLSVLVVHKHGEQKPGAGFFALAKRLGKNTSDPDKFFIDELMKVKAANSSRAGTKPTVSEIAGRAIETLPFRIPEYAGASHPISRGTPKFYKPDALKDSGEGRTPRTGFFERILVGIFLRLGRSVPYAFNTIEGEIRSLDAGCLKFLLNRPIPEITIECNRAGEIASVTPVAALMERYVNDDLLFRQFSSEKVTSNLPFDITAPPDERRRAISERVVREGASAFRATVLWAWRSRCAVSGTALSCTLDAAHIYPYNGLKTNDPCNGIALRSDVHSLFDAYLLSFRYINDRLAVNLSKELRDSEYEKYLSVVIEVPAAQSHRPHPELIKHHQKQFVEAERKRA